MAAGANTQLDVEFIAPPISFFHSRRYHGSSMALGNDMHLGRRDTFLGYVKVEIRTRSPRLWGWTIYRNGSDTVVAQNSQIFGHAEDAWRDGQRMLESLEAGPVLRAAELNRAA